MNEKKKIGLSMRNGNREKRIYDLHILWGVLLLMACMGMHAMTARAENFIHGYFLYTVEEDSVTITAYTGKEKEVTIPNMIAGNPVNTIAKGAFANCKGVEKINLPDTITTIEEGALPVGVKVVYNSNLGETGESEESQESKVSEESGVSVETKASDESQGQGEQNSNAEKESTETSKDGETQDTGSQSVVEEVYGSEEINIGFEDETEGTAKDMSEGASIAENSSEAATTGIVSDGKEEKGTGTQTGVKESETLSVILQERVDPEKRDSSPVLFVIAFVIVVIACGVGFILWKKRNNQ